MPPRRSPAAGFAALVALGVAAVPTLTGCAEQRPEVVAGQASVKVAGPRRTVLIPTGALKVTVGAPVRRIGARSAVDGVPHDGSFVPVAWSFDPTRAVPGQSVLGQSAQSASVIVTVGETPYALPAPYTVTDGVVDGATHGVAYVPGNASSTVEVTYDGLSQTWEPSSRRFAPRAAAPLYAAATGSQDLPCPGGPQTQDDITATVICRISTERMPYLPGHGWAEPGQAFVLVGFGLAVAQASSNGLALTLGNGSIAMTVDGDESVTTLGPPMRTAPGFVGGATVFKGSATGARLTVEATFPVTDGGADTSGDVTVKRTFTLP